MCGIYGAVTRKDFLNLRDVNKKRGDFCNSSLLVNDKQFEIHKVPLTAKSYSFPRKVKYDLFLGHTQAPTSSKRIFTPITSHPFIYENWVVAHNGVLTNFKKLKEEFCPEWENPVDSSIIPFLLTVAENHIKDPVQAIASTMELLEGTYGLWMWNADTKITYLAKCGVTLHARLLDNVFSSVKFGDFEPLEDGSIYQFTQEGITQVGNFDCDSPFFTV
jgi:glucosamine 6-phosphate synthetase-like amidotransferase/phosphosugar isomerase protein